MKIVEASTRCTALLRHSGENAAVQVRFQLSEFRKEFPNGIPSLFVKRPGDAVGQYGGNPKISHIRPNFENLILCSGDEDHPVECLIAGSDIGVFKIPIVMTELRIASPDEQKQYKISVNDDGSLSATEVVE